MPTSVAAWLSAAWAAIPAVVQAVIISLAVSNAGDAAIIKKPATPRSTPTQAAD